MEISRISQMYVLPIYIYTLERLGLVQRLCIGLHISSRVISVVSSVLDWLLGLIALVRFLYFSVLFRGQVFWDLDFTF